MYKNAHVYIIIYHYTNLTFVSLSVCESRRSPEVDLTSLSSLLIVSFSHTLLSLLR